LEELATKADIENVVCLLQQLMERMDQRFDGVERRFDAVDSRLDRIIVFRNVSSEFRFRWRLWCKGLSG